MVILPSSGSSLVFFLKLTLYQADADSVISAVVMSMLETTCSQTWVNVKIRMSYKISDPNASL